MIEIARKYTAVPVGEGQIRYRVRLEVKGPTDLGTPEARSQFLQVLEMLVGNPALVCCGPALICDKAVIAHEGSHWILEMEAIAEKE